MERFVEIGVKTSPTVAGLATNTLKLPEYAHSTVEVLNAERDAAVLFATDTDPEPESEDERRQRSPSRRAGRCRQCGGRAGARACRAVGWPAPDDIVFDAADATLALIALSAKMRIDQIEELDSIESITDGASSRRNQLLVDLGSELNLGAIDGAAEADLAGLRSQVTKLARTYKPYGPVLSDAINDQLRTVLGPSGKRPAAIAERVKKTWELGDGWAKHVTVEVALGTREGTSVRGGAHGPPARGRAGRRRLRRQGHRRRGHFGGRAPRHCGGPAVGRRRWRRDGRRGRAERVHRPDHRPRRCARLGGPPGAGPAGPRRPGQRVAGRPPMPSSSTWSPPNSARTGHVWWRRCSTARRPCVFDDRWASAREDLVKLWLIDEGDIDADWARLSERFEGAGHVVGTQATWWQGKALAAGRQIHASLYGRIAAGAENPEPGPLQRRNRRGDRRFEGLDRRVGGRPAARRRCDGHRDDVQARRRPAGVLPHAVPRQRPLRRGAVGGAPPTWRPTPTSTRWSQWVGTEQTESLGPQSIHLKDAQTPTLLFPFAAPRVAGDLSEAGSRSEMEMKVLLWAVQRLIGGLSHIGAERDIASRLHVVLPGSPNRGMFGGDGAYGEAKSALDAVVTRLEGRVVVGAASQPGARADRLDPGHRADGPQRRDRRRRRGGRRHHLLDRRDGRACCSPCATSSPRWPRRVSRSRWT